MTREESNIWGNAEISLVEMSKDREIKNRARSKMDELDAVKIQDSTKKIIRGKSKAPFDEVIKDDGFRIMDLCGKIISSGRAPLDQGKVLDFGLLNLPPLGEMGGFRLFGKSRTK